MGYHWDIVEISWGIFSGIGQTNQHYLGVYMEIYRNGYKGDLYVCNPAIWGLVPENYGKVLFHPLVHLCSFHFP